MTITSIVVRYTPYNEDLFNGEEQQFAVASSVERLIAATLAALSQAYPAAAIRVYQTGEQFFHGELWRLDVETDANYASHRHATKMFLDQSTAVQAEIDSIVSAVFHGFEWAVDSDEATAITGNPN